MYREYETELKKRIVENQNSYFDTFLRGPYSYIYPYLKKKIISERRAYDINDLENVISTNASLVNCIDDRLARKWIHCAKSWADLFLFHRKYRIKIRKIKAEDKDCFSIVTIVKNEALYITEWIQFYLSIGVDRFYIFDNESTDNLQEVLADYIKEGIVIYNYYPGRKVQLNAYNDAIKAYKDNSVWMAFLDADEFLFPVQDSCVQEVFKKYEKFCGIGANWIVYGPCGNTTRQEGGLLENYTLTFDNRNNELNCRIKSIVRPNNVLAFISPHYCLYKGKGFAVNENGERIGGDGMYTKSSAACTKYNSANILRINHYWTKSLEELKEKCQRGYPDGTKNPEYDKILGRLDYPLVEDKTILQVVERSEIKER